MCISVQFSRSVVFDSLWPHGLQHTRLTCPSLSPGDCSNSCPLSQWCHLAILCPVAPFSSYPQSFPASGSFWMSWLFASGRQIIGASALASVLLVNSHGWFPLELTGLISLQSKDSQASSLAPVWKHRFFGVQRFLLSSSHIHTWLLEKPQLWLDGTLLAK